MHVYIDIYIWKYGGMYVSRMLQYIGNRVYGNRQIARN